MKHNTFVSSFFSQASILQGSWDQVGTAVYIERAPYGLWFVVFSIKVVHIFYCCTKEFKDISAESLLCALQEVYLGERRGMTQVQFALLSLTMTSLVIAPYYMTKSLTSETATLREWWEWSEEARRLQWDQKQGIGVCHFSEQLDVCTLYVSYIHCMYIVCTLYVFVPCKDRLVLPCLFLYRYY